MNTEAKFEELGFMVCEDEIDFTNETVADILAARQR